MMPIIDFGDDFADLMIDFTVNRATIGDRQAGAFEAAKTWDELTIKGIPLQSLGGSEMKLVQPEDGQYTNDMRKLYTSEKLQTRETTGAPDVITDPVTGMLYSVYQQSDRTVDGGFYKTIIRKVQGDAFS